MQENNGIDKKFNHWFCFAPNQFLCFQAHSYNYNLSKKFPNSKQKF